MKTIEQLIRDNTNENGFQWGIETVSWVEVTE